MIIFVIHKYILLILIKINYIKSLLYSSETNPSITSQAKCFTELFVFPKTSNIPSINSTTESVEKIKLICRKYEQVITNKIKKRMIKARLRYTDFSTLSKGLFWLSTGANIRHDTVPNNAKAIFAIGISAYLIISKATAITADDEI